MPGRRNGNIIYEWIPREGASEQIYAKLSDIMISLSAKDHLKMPERIDNIVKLKLTPEAREQYDKTGMPGRLGFSSRIRRVWDTD